MGRTMLNQSKYIKTIPFSGLFNWSVQYLSETKISFNAAYPLVRIGEFLKRNKTGIEIQDDVRYTRVTIRVRNGGVTIRDTEIGKNIGTKRQFIVSEGQFILSKIDARNGAMGIIPAELDGAIVTQDFLPYDIDKEKINPQYLVLVSTTAEFVAFCQTCSSGTTNRQRIEENKFLDIKIPLPSLAEQNALVAAYNDRIATAYAQDNESIALECSIEKFLFSQLGIRVILKEEEKKEKNSLLSFINYSTVKEWGLDKIISTNNYNSNNYQVANLESNSKFINEVFRGKSPKYSADSNRVMLNQKCIRWNAIETEWAKTVNENWINSIANKFFTQEGDILINSTGEGTIGRSSYVTKEHEGLLYDSHVLLLRLNPQYINPIYFTCVFNSKYGQSQVDGVKSAQSTKQTELGINNLLKIVLPIPPLEVQNEIVAHISGLKEQITQLRTSATTNRTLALATFEQEIFQ